MSNVTRYEALQLAGCECGGGEHLDECERCIGCRISEVIS